MTIDYTPQMIQEIIKCSCDPVYFMKMYAMKDLSPADVEQFTIWTVDAANYKVTEIGTERASGRTRYLAGYALWKATFDSYKTIMVGTHNSHSRDAIRNYLYDMYEQLPVWMKHKAKEYNKHRVVFENDSQILFDLINERFCRGRSLDVLLLDNWELVKPTIRDEVVQSIAPTLHHTNTCITTGDNVEWLGLNK